MTKKQLFIFSFSILFFLLAFAIEKSNLFNFNIDTYTQNIQTNLNQREGEINDLFKNQEFLSRILSPEISKPETRVDDLNKLAALEQKDYTVNIYRDKELVFWSNNDIDFDNYSNNINEPFENIIKLQNGFYQLIKTPIVLNSTTYNGIGLIPIKHNYSLNSPYLKPDFLVDVPQEIELSVEETPYGITSKSGTNLCYLKQEKKLVDYNQQLLLFITYLLGFICLGFTANRMAINLIAKYNLWVGALFLSATFFGLKFLGSLTDFTSKFSSFKVFEAAPKEFVFSNSLGDLLINIILLLWVVIFLHRQYNVNSISKIKSSTRQYAFTFFSASLIVMSIINIAYAFKMLIFHSNIDFNFENVFNTSYQSMVAIVGIILLLIGLFLLSHLIMIITIKIGVPKNKRLVTYAVASLITIPLSNFLALDIQYPFIYLAVLTFITLFDMFVDNSNNNDNGKLPFVVFWLLLLGILSSLLLYNYNSKKHAKSRQTIAFALAESRDTIAEQAINDLYQLLKKQDFIKSVAPPYPLPFKNTKLRNVVNKYYATNTYLFNNYTYKVNAFYSNNEAAIINQKLSFDEADFLFSNSNSTNYSNLFYRNNSKEPDTYILKLETHPSDIEDNKILLCFEFTHKRRNQSKVYTELLTRNPFKELKDIDEYDYGIYKNDSLVYSTSSKFSSNVNTMYSDFPRQSGFYEVKQNNNVRLLYQSPNENKVVVLEKGLKGTLANLMSLFSFIFVLLLVAIVALSIVNTFLSILPSTFSFQMFKKSSLSSSIQIAVITLTVLSFIIIGLVTVVYFRNSHEDYHEKRLVRKTQSVIQDTEHEIELLLTQKPELVDDLSAALQTVDLKAISRIHRSDINLYDLKGKLIQSSEIDIYDKGVISKQINPLAYQALSIDREAEYIQDIEHLGSLSYKSAYIPLIVSNKQDKLTLGYLGLPYYSKQSSLREDVTVFMGTIFNVYVLLLLIAGAIAFKVADSISRPISSIVDRLKEFKLGGRNAKLVWNRQDELGILIDEYNSMVDEIENSAEMLAQSEREEAWREMAKQVAHEIKNPLTPMKLSIQYLQHAHRSNPDNIEPLMKRVCNTLIEQIDNLSQIASEFSNFAKMPKAENQKIELNHLVRSVYDLFKEHRDKKISLKIPTEEFYVYADKNHLIRVLNNLVKNAIQAIPDNRVGVIDISLIERDNKAVVIVKDNGTGIDDKMKEKVFVPNFTTKNSGTGLGLAISKSIIDSVSGSIYFETEVGVGTSFFVELPIMEVRMPEEIISY